MKNITPVSVSALVGLLVVTSGLPTLPPVESQQAELGTISGGLQGTKFATTALPHAQPPQELLKWLSALRTWLLAFPTPPSKALAPAPAEQTPAQVAPELTPTFPLSDQPSSPPIPQLSQPTVAILNQEFGHTELTPTVISDGAINVLPPQPVTPPTIEGSQPFRDPGLPIANFIAKGRCLNGGFC